VVYVPGNHDELLCDYDGMSFGNISIRNEVIHTIGDGRRLLVLHGDQFDGVVKSSPYVALPAAACMSCSAACQSLGHRGAQ